MSFQNMPTMAAVLAAFAVASACDDSPTDPPPEEEPLELIAAAAPTSSSCTRTWANGIGGLWEDPSRWSPSGVPTITDHVCIDAPGTYTVTSSTAPNVTSLTIGGSGATVDFTFNPAFGGAIIADSGLTIASGSTLDVNSVGAAALTGNAGVLTVSGTLRVVNSCACGGTVANLSFVRINNYGRMELEAPSNLILETVGAGTGWSNYGVVITSGYDSIDVGSSHLYMSEGLIAGTTPIIVEDVIWWNGTLDVLPSGQAIVEVRDRLDFMPSDSDLATISGRIGLDGEGADPRIEFHNSVPSSVFIGVVARQDETIQLTTFPPADTAIIDGTLNVTSYSDATIDFGAIAVDGRLWLTGNGTARLTGDALLNRGTLDLDGPPVTYSASLLHNSGNIRTQSQAGVSLTMESGTELLVDPGSTIDANLPTTLIRATLRGTGQVGPVTSLGGTLEPGSPYGTLSLSSLILDASSTVRIPIGGTDPTSYGQLDVSGATTFGGTLRALPAVGPAVGNCGDVITPIRHLGTQASGAFATLLDGISSTKRAWRQASTSDSLSLAGYSPAATKLAFSGGGLHVWEGGDNDALHVCLGANPPLTTVTLQPTSALGQVSVRGRVAFPPYLWQFPQTMIVSAVDDAVVEARLTDTLSYTLSSKSPFYSGSVNAQTRVTVHDDDGDADLQIALEDPIVPVSVGSPINVVYRITNNGPTLSTGSTLILDPQGATHLSFQTAQRATCREYNSGVLRCAFMGLSPGASDEVVITYDAVSAGSTSLSATVVGDQPDGDASNDQIVVTVDVN